MYSNHRKIERIVLHYTATPEGRDVDIKDVRQWHIDRGFDDVGYHFLVKLNGDIQRGRPIDVVGAHCYGYNSTSIGVCFVGGMSKDMSEMLDTRTPAQKKSLELLLGALLRMYPDAELCGHRDLSSTDCPGIDVKLVYAHLINDK
jgi:N-acetylmuramoyl-L-alanine amidase